MRTAWPPLEIGVGSPAVITALDAFLQRGAGLAHAFVAESTEEVLEEDGGLALLVTAQVLLEIADEVVEALSQVGGCGGSHQASPAAASRSLVRSRAWLIVSQVNSRSSAAQTRWAR